MNTLFFKIQIYYDFMKWNSDAQCLMQMYMHI